MAVLEYRGKPLQARKQFFEGTARGASPSETLENLRPYWDLIGLTRLANITGLDRIGIPVTLAIRPNSPDIGTNSGKGSTLQTALASAAMEALEHHCGEDFSSEFVIEPYESLAKNARTIPIQRLAISRNSLFHPAIAEKWCFGWDLVGNCDVAVPYDQVKVGYESRFHPTRFSSFQSGTNGLASGNSLSEAISSALLELIERDAIACHHRTQDVTGEPPPVIRQNTIKFPSVVDLLTRLRSVEIDAYIFDLTTDLEIPVFYAVIFDQNGPNVVSGTGWGASLDAETAMARALTEAAQTRLIHIYGARDDLFRRRYEACLSQDFEYYRREFGNHSRFIDAGDLASTQNASFEEDIRFIMQKLEAAGMNQVIVLDLTPRGMRDLAGVKVIVPGLEGYLYEFYRPGERVGYHCSITR